MKSLALAALPLAFAIAACDGPREEIGEEVDNINNADGLLTEGPAEPMGEAMDKEAEAMAERMDETAEALNERADAVEDTDPVRAQQLEQRADTLEDTADGI